MVIVEGLFGSETKYDADFSKILQNSKKISSIAEDDRSIRKNIAR